MHERRAPDCCSATADPRAAFRAAHGEHSPPQARLPLPRPPSAHKTDSRAPSSWRASRRPRAASSSLDAARIVAVTILAGDPAAFVLDDELARLFPANSRPRATDCDFFSCNESARCVSSVCTAHRPFGRGSTDTWGLRAMSPPLIVSTASRSVGTAQPCRNAPQRPIASHQGLRHATTRHALR